MNNYNNDNDRDMYEVIDLIKDDNEFRNLLDSTFENDSIQNHGLKNKILDSYKKNEHSKKVFHTFRKMAIIAACIVIPLVLSYSLFSGANNQNNDKEENISKQSNKENDSNNKYVNNPIPSDNNAFETNNNNNITTKPTPNSQNINKVSTIHGVYVGNEQANVISYENWLGKNADGVLAYTGNSNWSDFDGSVGWACNIWSGTTSTILWSIPLIPAEANLNDAGNSLYNSHYIEAAKKIAAFKPDEPVIYIRTAWGFNTDRFPWKAKGKKDDFIKAWKQFVDSFRSVSDKFIFTWCPQFDDSQLSLEDYYPGNDYVDIVGIEIFDDAETYNLSNPEQRWNFYLDASNGLNWLASFAKNHSKKLSIPLWGLSGKSVGDNEYFIEQMALWMNNNKAIYSCYWNSNDSHQSMLSQDQFPKSTEKYKEYFGK